MDLVVSASADTDGSRLVPVPEEIANPAQHIFIPLDETAKKIRKLVKKAGQITFVRAPVATGKSTLAYYLVESFPNEYIMVQTANYEAEWLYNLIRATTKKSPKGTKLDDVAGLRNAATEALEVTIEEKKTLVIDEAHCLFGCPEIYTYLTKQLCPYNKIKMLLFSAAGTGLLADGATIATPSEITKKYMWYPPLPNGDYLSSQLEEAGIYLNGDAVDFLMKICCGHRGIFMMTLGWVQACQENEHNHQENDQQKKWDLTKIVTEVRHSFSQSHVQEKRDAGSGWSIGLRQHMMRSRAVKVNGKYDDVNDVPNEVAQVSFGGSRRKDQLGGKERELTIAGFLVPEQRVGSQKEFMDYNWSDPSILYGLANSVMANYYRDRFLASGKFQREMLDFIPKTGSDLLARVLPFMSFTTVIDNVIIHNGKLKTPLSPQQLPYEDHYNSALGKVLGDLGYSPAMPLNSDGKVDLIASFNDENAKTKTCAIETIMSHTGSTLVRQVLFFVCLKLFGSYHAFPPFISMTT